MEAEDEDMKGTLYATPQSFFPAFQLDAHVHVERCCPKCGPWTSILSITWQRVQNANSWPHLTPTESDSLVVGHLPSDYFAQENLRSTDVQDYI